MGDNPPSNSSGAKLNSASNSSVASKAKEQIENMKKSGILTIIIQVFAGMIATYLIYLIALAVMKSDKVVIDEKYAVSLKRKVDIVSGFIDASMKNVNYNTIVPFASNYMPIRPSVNIKGGAQFTYSMWMYIGSEATDSSVANKIIFLKGSNSKYNFRVQDNEQNTTSVHLGEHMVFCPMFRFGNNTKSFDIRFNTLNRYDEVLSIDSVQASDSVYRNNLLETVTNSWFLVTITFEDNVPINEFENGIQVKFYVNDLMYKVGRYQSALKQNYGDLFLFPNAEPISGVKVSNMKYFNYVLSESDIRGIVSQGANVSSSSVYMPPAASKPPVLSDYNKLDIYNV